MLDKSLKLSENQYKAAVMGNRVLGRLLAKAAPTDDTPYEITLGEVLEVAGEELTGN